MCFAWKKHVDNHLYSMLLLKWAIYIAFVGNDCRMFTYCFFSISSICKLTFFIIYIDK